MAFQGSREIDDIAKQFMESAYQIGVSVILMNKFLLESKYAFTIIIIYDILSNFNISPDSYNYSSDSLT